MATVESLWYTVHSHMTIPGGGGNYLQLSMALKSKDNKELCLQPYKSVWPLIWVKKHGTHTHV